MVGEVHARQLAIPDPNLGADGVNPRPLSENEVDQHPSPKRNLAGNGPSNTDTAVPSEPTHAVPQAPRAATVEDIPDEGDGPYAATPPEPTHTVPQTPRAATMEDIPDEGDGPQDHWYTLPARELDTSTSIAERDYVNSQSTPGHVPRQKAGEKNLRPSEYLEMVCPLCFAANTLARTPDHL